MTNNSKYRTIAVKEELYNLIKDRAKKCHRGISNQVEYEFTKEDQVGGKI